MMTSSRSGQTQVRTIDDMSNRYAESEPHSDHFSSARGWNASERNRSQSHPPSAQVSSMQESSMIIETLKTSRKGAVLFVDIAAPPMNLLGPEMACDLASLIQQSEADTTIKVTSLMFRGRNKA